MKVLNMEVHMKLNHKKKKSAKTEGFRFTGFSSSTSAPPPTPLPSITKYQNKGWRRGKNREYFDHIKTCGLNTDYSNLETDRNETHAQMASLDKIEQLEPLIKIFVKEEIEIKTEPTNDPFEIDVKKETIDTNDDNLEAEYGKQ